MNISNFAKRAGAFGIDNAIIVAILHLLSYFFVRGKDVDTMMVFGLYVFLTIAYFAIQEYSSAHATIGKRVFGLVVCDTNYQEISIVQAFVRNIARIINFPVFALGYLPILFTSKKQGIHDFIGRTMVVEIEEIELLHENVDE